jgi:ACR3 family arsenite transporter
MTGYVRLEEAQVKQTEKLDIGFFDKYLTVWVALCMVAGVMIGKFLPGCPRFSGGSNTRRSQSPSLCLSGS